MEEEKNITPMNEEGAKEECDWSKRIVEMLMLGVKSRRIVTKEKP